jgi:hypothetical protein
VVIKLSINDLCRSNQKKVISREAVIAIRPGPPPAGMRTDVLYGFTGPISYLRAD